MARGKKGSQEDTTAASGANFASELIRALNKERGERVAYNLSEDESPTMVKRWISTGSRQLDYIIRNARGGGYPEGRVVEIFGPPSIGKSHIAIQACISAQRMGGLAVYIDTENATSIDNLMSLGVNVARGFVFIQENCTEAILDIIEKTILRVKAMSRDIPVVIVWDSVAASSPKAELEGAYDKDTIGLQARSLSKGMRKITNVIGDNNVLLICLNQVRTKIGVMYGDPDAPPGGKAIPFHASVRIKLGAGAHILNKEKEPIGITVSAKTIKNKIAPPFRTCTFEIHFGRGLREHEQLFDIMRRHGEVTVGHVTSRQELACVEGEGAWKTFYVKDAETLDVVFERKFYKAQFDELWRDPNCLPYLEAILEEAMVRKLEDAPQADIDPDSYVEMSAVANMIDEELGSGGMTANSEVD